MTALEATYEEYAAELARRKEGITLAEEADRLAGSFREFVRAAWHVLEPATEFVPNWHIDAICDGLESARHGEIDRLLINIPPRHMKSLTVTVLWPAWRWTFEPHIKFLTASHSDDPALRDAVKTRDLIRSDWYRNRWPDVILKGDTNMKSRYENTATGYRVATHVGGGTGDGGDVIIIDDPHQADGVVSATDRAKAIAWHSNTIASRFNDPKTGVEVVVMQRLHEEDLSGKLLEREGRWTHICLPARYERSHPFVWPDDPRTEEGELLWPEHIPEKTLDNIAEDMTAMVAAGQLQQRPAPREGDVLKRGAWRWYDRESSFYAERNVFDGSRLPQFDRIVHSWDTSLKDRAKSDFAVGTVWGVKGADAYLLRIWRERAGLNAIVDAMTTLYDWTVGVWPDRKINILVENAATGPEAIAEVKRKVTGVVAISAKGSKEMRAEAAAPALEGHNCFLPGAGLGDLSGYDVQTPSAVQLFVEEAATFPNGANDDQVDSWSQAINWVRRQSRPTSVMVGLPVGRA